VGVEAFPPEITVQALDEAVICRLARSQEVEADITLVSPEVEIATDEFRALIDPVGDCREL
jgi:hypothetical protein